MLSTIVGNKEKKTYIGHRNLAAIKNNPQM